MRKLFNLFAAALVMVAAVSCEKSEVLPCDAEGKVVTLSATIDNGRTKTSLGGKEGNEYPVLWSEGDEIAVIQGLNIYQFTLVGKGGTTSGTFTCSEPGDFDPDSPYTAFYPYSAVSVEYNAIKYSIPTTQKYAANSFGPGAMPMAATVTSGNEMTFNNLFGVVKVVVKGASDEVLNSIEFGSTIPLCGDSKLEETGGKLSFSIKVNADNFSQYTTYASNIKLNCVDENKLEGVSIDNADGKEFLIAVPAGSQQFAVVLHTNFGSYYKSVSADKTINVGEILKMQIIDLTADVERNNMSIDYGSNGNGTLIGKTVWAPVNVGYEASNPIGTLFRADLSDPCPEGWRLPERNELKYLYNYNFFKPGSTSKIDSWEYYYSYRKTENGIYFYGVATPKEQLNLNCVVLPINLSHEWGPCGRYWTSTRINSNTYALILTISKKTSNLDVDEIGYTLSYDERLHGYVRCVKEQ